MRPVHTSATQESVKRWLVQTLLRRLDPAQKLNVQPSDTLRANLARKVARYLEFTAVLLNDRNNWSGDWAGPYEAVEPLFGSYSALLAQSGSQMAAADFQSLDMSYRYLAYIARCD